MKRYAIIVATDEYTTVKPNTPYCHNDAELLSKTLFDCCDFAQQDINLQLLSPTNHKTPSELIEQLKTIAQQSQPGDTILFYYAGHGTLHNSEPYIILPNTEVSNIEQTALPLRDISNALRLPDRVNIRIFDACHSGYDVRDETNSPPDAEGFVRAITIDQAQGWFTFAACREDEYSHCDPTSRHGIFTYALCEAIQTHEEDKDILPERIKIDVCGRVALWCKQTGHIQTPTLNAAISGNLVMARRKIKQLSAIRQDEPPTDSDAIADVPGRDLIARLALARSLTRIGSEAHIAQLTKYIEQVREVLQARIEMVNSHGCQVSLSKVKSVNNMPNSFKPPIARYIEKESLQALHDIRIIEQREERDNNIFMSILDRKPPRISYDYVISQTHPWPDSYIELKIETDGYLPSGLLYYYLIPLQTKVCLDHGVALTNDPLDINFTLEPRSGYIGFLDFNVESVSAQIDRHVEDGIRALNERYTKRVVERLDYLEREKSR